MSRADDDMDDEGLEGLGSFRAMFRDMPDEEPPQRGLAELMAAARVKAEEMATPSLWERFLQTMRRPQVMALATIMILIGGAVFISQRKSEMDASPTVTQPSEEAAPARQFDVHGAAAGSGMALDEVETQDKKRDGESAAAEGAADSKTDAQRDRSNSAAGRGGETSANKEEATRRPVRSIETKTPSKMSKPASKSPPKPTKVSGGDGLLEGGFDDAKPGTGTSTGASGGGGAVGGTTSGATAGPRTPSPSPTTTLAPEAEPVAPSPQANKQPSQTVQQLHATAKKLASAGDCAQVRTLAKQIAAKDAKYYRDNIATDSLLATCLK